jgi:undecaprenyl-diphosphatase
VEAKILLWIHARADPWLDALFRFSHELGTPTFCTALVVVAVLVALLRKRKEEAALWAVLGISTYLLQKGIKVVVARPRPELWQGPIELSSHSFPSGHALAAATFFPLIGRALGMRFPELTRLSLAGGVLFAFYVGFGRLYLGVHWPSDVLAGWAMGALQTYAAVTYLKSRRAEA